MTLSVPLHHVCPWWVHARFDEHGKECWRECGAVADVDVRHLGLPDDWLCAEHAAFAPTLAKSWRPGRRGGFDPDANVFPESRVSRPAP